jgi:BirA family transcriptional regulator, biotin operon repressor / biotin---[acetyl-CoA-carboxylase] ligase
MAVPLPHGVDLKRPLLASLAAGGRHSSGALARALAASESEVVAAIGELRALGIEVAATAEGFELRGERSLELLDAAAIRRAVREEMRARLQRLDVLFEVNSTNSWLLERPAPPHGCADAALAEIQHAGRGRQGRRWISPFGASLALSLGWTFRAEGVTAALSLAVGVAICRALEGLGARGLRLKWPNDVWLGDRKLGGVLVETRTGGGSAHVVIGIGLNLHLSEESMRLIGAPALAALDAATASPPSRNELAGALLSALLSMLPLFERHGFAAFRDEWRGLDALCGRPARVLLAAAAVDGVARGVDEDGGLLLEHGGKIDKFIAGEASLRLMTGDA